MAKIAWISLFFVITFSVAFGQKQFWGTASQGGTHGNGFIFRSDSIGDNLEIVHHFTSVIDGENIGALLYASNHKLYGLAASGGQNATNVFTGGTLFEYDLDTDQFRVIQHFGPSSTALPNVYMPKGEGLAGLTEVSPGVIYGLMRQGQYVFSYNANTGAMGQPFALPTYQGGATNTTLQNRIAESFYKAADGYLYAATYTNSSCPIANPNMGSIMRLQPATNTLTVRYKSVCLTSGGYSYTGFFAEANGKLYSATLYGGTNNTGVIYEYAPATNIYTKKYDFGTGASSYEASSMVVAKNGKLYGTAYGGGVGEDNLPAGGGMLYEFDLTTNTFTKKHDFLLGVGWLGDMGSYPKSLVSSSNGKLYGTTQYGVFEYNPATSTIRMAGRFWTPGFAPSIVQVCRKPAYQFQTVSTHAVCNGATFTLDFASTNANSVTWKHDNVIDPSQTATELSFTSFTAADAGTWICTLTNECGSTVAQTITLALNEPDQPSITADGPIAFCAGATVGLSAPEGFSGYAWSTGETSREIVVSESGDYTVTVNNGCESPVSTPMSVTSHELPESPTAIEALPHDVLKAIGISEIYEWTRNDVMLDEQTAEIHVVESGTYKVRSVTGEGCRSAAYALLEFVVTGMESNPEDVIAIYPNPGKGILNLRANRSMHGVAEISVFNATGSLVLTRSIDLSAEISTVNLETLPVGLYHVMIRKGKRVVSGKIVIQ